eukprot:TRINITY_DN5079_c4_g1_i1.p1 TRINITY_DN5079_c4_g1~~TRINITY_DN5079_c4_g1_i1.p1  ORF type:complete len:480 (+),score=62.88 TRINITY_DN5079_c4_g1_i1:86-1525(+)
MAQTNKTNLRILCAAILATLVMEGSGADVGCGEPAFEATDCTDIHCPRWIQGHCVRGLPENSECTLSNDCQQADCLDRITRELCAGPEDQCECGPVHLEHMSSKSSVVSALGAAACFGCMFVPLHRHINPSDIDVVTQFILASGVWIVGVGFALARPGTVMHPFAVVGGVAYSVANILTPLVVALIGAPVAMSIWAVTSMITGWGLSYYGMFGLPESSNEINTSLSIAGLSLGAVGILCFQKVRSKKKERVSLVGSTSAAVVAEIGANETSAMYTAAQGGEEDFEEDESGCEDDDLPDPQDSPTLSQNWVQKLGPLERRVAGYLLSAVAGVTYGAHMSPVIYMAHNWDSLSRGNTVPFSPYGLDYVFSQASGLLLGTTSHALLAILGGWGAAHLNSSTLLPSLCSGAIWGIGHALAIYAATTFNLAVSHPIIVVVTPVIASFWSTAIYRSVSSNHFQSLSFALALSVASAACTIGSITD